MSALGWRGLTAGGSRRRLVGPLLAGLVLGLGGVTVAVSVGHASDQHNPFRFLEALFGGPARTPEPPKSPRQAARYVALPEAGAPPRRRLVPAPRPGPALTTHWRVRREAVRRSTRIPRAVADGAAGRRTVCVRMCDGYLFPLGNLRTRADLPVHAAACAAACPGARTSLYTLAAGAADLDQAVSPQGQPYRASALANVYRQRRVADCSCQGAGQTADGPSPLAIANDPTLRAGDAVATRDSARVAVRVPGSLALVDYRSARIPAGARRQIEGRVGALQREARERAFRQVLRAAERESVVRVASAGGFLMPERAPGGFQPLRVVQPSPYGR